MTRSLLRNPKVTVFYLSIFLLVFCVTAKAQVQVTATAATTGPSIYTTVKGAFDAINAGTHKGVVNIVINANTTETATASLNASGTGSASYTSVNIKPQVGTNPIISGGIGNGTLIKLNGSRNVTIDGSNNGSTSRNLTITNTSTANSNVLQIGSVNTTPISNVVVKNSNLINGTNTSSAVLVGDVTIVGSPGYFNNITIQNNSIQKAYIGIYCYATVATNNGNNTLVTENDLDATGANAIRLVGIYAQGVDGITVSNNSIGNFESTGAEFDRAIWFATATKNATITGNTVYNMSYTGASSYAPIGLNISPGITNANITVADNIIKNLGSTGTGTTMGIFSYGASSEVTYRGNKISNIKNTNTSGYGAAGILLAHTISAATKVYNNFIWDVAAYGYTDYSSSSNGNGIVVDGGGGYEISFNTVVLNTNATLTGGHKASGLLVTANVTATGAINLRNNILVNLQTIGNANSRFAISNLATSGSAVFSNINYNNYYTASGNLSNTGTNASITNTIAELQTSLGGNVNSVNTQPILSGADDLHLVTPQPQLLGIPIAGITTDIDGEARHATTPYMGADEYSKRVTPDANGIVYVKKGSLGNGLSWAYAVSELADALKAAKTNTDIKEIWVAGGNYKPMYSPADNNFGNVDGRNNAFLLVKDVKVYGGFAGTETQVTQRNWALNKTILSGEMQNDANSANNAYHVVISAADVGIATLDGFTVSDGVAFLEDSGLSRTTVNGAMLTNRFAGGIYCANSSPLIKNCLLTNNTGYASTAFRSESGSPVVVNTVMSENSGTLYNIVLVATGSPVSLINVSIVNNRCTLPLLMDNGTLYNSIVWGNTILSGTPAPLNITIQNSIVQKGTFGTVDIGTDPLFNDVVAGDYSLKATSPAINGGDNTLYPAGLNTDKDLAGNTRLIGSNIDLGAYEATIQSQSITAGNLTKTYGDADFEPGATASSGLTVSYASADNSIAEAYQDVNDANKWKLKIKKVGNVNITASQAGGNGYAAAPDKIFALTIQPKALTVTATGNNKIYDATASATVNLSSNVLADDVVTLAYTSATFGDENVGNNKTVTVNGITLSGTSAANYTFNTAASTTANITPFSLTVSATANNKVYNANNNATVTLTSNAFAGDNLTLAYISATFNDKTVASGKAVSVSGISLSGTDVGNYTFNTAAITTASITPFALTVTANGNNKAYNGNADANVVLSHNGFAGDLLTLNYASATFNDQNVGVNKAVNVTGISVSGADAGNYTFNATASTTASITPITLNISAQAKAKTYGDLDPALTYTSAGLIGADAITGTLLRDVGVNVGTYAIRQGTLTAGANYTISYTTANFNIVAKVIAITMDAKTKIYGDTDPSITFTATSLIGNDTFTGSPVRDIGENVGTYAIGQGTLTAGSNYRILFTPANLTINRATLTVTAANVARCFGQANPSFVLNYSGFKRSDNENSLTTKPQAATLATVNSQAGSYPVTVSGGASDNYTFVYANGTLRVDALPTVAIIPSRLGTIGKGLTLQLTATGGTSYSWANAQGIISGQNSAALTVRPTTNTTYTVTVTNANGCSSTMSYAVTVADDLSILKANNLLSPNGDGVNDVWKVDNIDMYPQSTVRIFDRAGRVLYTKKGYDNTWDGSYNGQLLAESTYYYIIDLGEGRALRGFITLVRESR